MLGTPFSITEINQNYIIAMVGDQIEIEAGGTETTGDGFSVSPWQYYPLDGAWDVTISKNNLSVTKKLAVGSSSDTDYVIGATSTAYETGLNRITHDTLLSAEKFSTISSYISDRHYPYKELKEAYEHTLL